jgi:hypothetical protein
MFRKENSQKFYSTYKNNTQSIYVHILQKLQIEQKSQIKRAKLDKYLSVYVTTGRQFDEKNKSFNNKKTFFSLVVLFLFFFTNYYEL